MLSVNRLCVIFAAVSALILTSTVKHPFFVSRLLGQRHGGELAWPQSKLSATERREQIFHARNRIAWDVIRGQKTLLEAATAFRGLGIYPSSELRRPEQRLEPVVLCQHVIQSVAMQGVGRGWDLEQVVCQLEEELYELRNQGGGVKLPGAPPGYVEIGKRLRGPREMR